MTVSEGASRVVGHSEAWETSRTPNGLPTPPLGSALTSGETIPIDSEQAEGTINVLEKSSSKMESKPSLSGDSDLAKVQQQGRFPRTQVNKCSRSESKRTALQRHCDFWDADHDGLIYPWDIYIGFRKLGFNIALCLWAAISMPLCSSYGTQDSWLPDPLSTIKFDNIYHCRHGSTTATYGLDAEIDMRRFDSIFSKYGEGRDYLTLRTLYNVWAGQCHAMDWFGWFAGGLEWIALYILLWPADGKLWRDDIPGVFDGSIFERIASERDGHMSK